MLASSVGFGESARSQTALSLRCLTMRNYLILSLKATAKYKKWRLVQVVPWFCEKESTQL